MTTNKTPEQITLDALQVIESAPDGMVTVGRKVGQVTRDLALDLIHRDLARGDVETLAYSKKINGMRVDMIVTSKGLALLCPPPADGRCQSSELTGDETCELGDGTLRAYRHRGRVLWLCPACWAMMVDGPGLVCSCDVCQRAR